MRTIKKITPSQKVNMGGIILDQPLPHKGTDYIDPFLLIHHWDDTMKGGQQQQNVGVGPHPHRGFAPVTLIFNGDLQHRDSEGNNSIVNAGGTQWMNSGKGIIHSERPTKELADKGGRFEIIQFWVNAPTKHKMDEPNYQPLTPEDMPTVLSKDKKVKIGVVAGDFNKKKSKIDTYSPLLILRLDIEEGGKMDIPVPKDFNAMMYVLDGTVTINDKETVHTKDFIEFNNDGTSFSIEGKANTRAILLSGSPLNEAVSTYGPFVMNTEREIMDALKDYQTGKMGVLVEEFD
jgi:redox-sensitive bicupin YhaK (pirin superfamily)